MSAVILYHGYLFTRKIAKVIHGGVVPAGHDNCGKKHIGFGETQKRFTLRRSGDQGNHIDPVRFNAFNNLRP